MGGSDSLALKHVSRILGHHNNPALLVSHFQAGTEQEEMPRPQNGQKGNAGLLKAQRILPMCFRARMSGEDQEE